MLDAQPPLSINGLEKYAEGTASQVRIEYRKLLDGSNVAGHCATTSMLWNSDAAATEEAAETAGSPLQASLSSWRRHLSTFL